MGGCPLRELAEDRLELVAGVPERVEQRLVRVPDRHVRFLGDIAHEGAAQLVAYDPLGTVWAAGDEEHRELLRAVYGLGDGERRGEAPVRGGLLVERVVENRRALRGRHDEVRRGDGQRGPAVLARPGRSG